MLNLQVQNDSLLLKHLHKIFNKLNIPWVHLLWEKLYTNGRLPLLARKGSFWWRHILKLLQSFKGIASVNLHNGSTCFFWNDLWHGRMLSKIFSEPFSFVKNPNISVQSARLTPQLHTLFHMPLSVEAFAQFQDFCSIIRSLQDTPEPDVCVR